MAQGEEHEPTKISRARVKAARWVGGTNALIADMMGLSVTTLEKHYGAELAQGKEAGGLRLGTTAFQLAYGDPDAETPIPPDKVMLMFVLKTRFGWTETGLSERELRIIVTGVMKVIQENVNDPDAIQKIGAGIERLLPDGA